MSKSYRDQRKYVLKHHREVCARRALLESSCVCDDWFDYRMKHYPEPSWHNRMVRQVDRGKHRNEMRHGWRCDWENVAPRHSDIYYW